MNLKTFFICLGLLLQLTIGKDLNCLTGYKILVRKTIQNENNQKEYKLLTKCLCPNNYFGSECESHIDIDCYLNPLNSLNQINPSNINEQMSFDLQFEVECWVHEKSEFLTRIELKEYLSKFNASNAFGVRQQFGKHEEIVWANTTDIFDAQGELKTFYQIKAVNKSEELSFNQKLKIMIGNNTKLYEMPFKYENNFLGFGLINGNIIYRTTLIDPQNGQLNLANYSETSIKISNVQEYVNSYNNLNQIQSETKSLAKNISELIKNGTINQTIQKYINGTEKPTNLDIIDPKITVKKQLPRFKIPIKINPFNSTFYNSIRIQLGITEQYQNIATHQVSLNSLLWTIPVNAEGVGLPVPSTKHLTVTDSSNKSYYRIIAVIIIGALIFFGLKYIHKKYKQWKNKQYTEFQDEDHSRKENNKKESQNHNESVRSSTSASTSQQCQLKQLK